MEILKNFFSESTLVGTPQGPALIKWLKNSVQLSWQPPQKVTNDLEYIIEEDLNGFLTTLGVTRVPSLNLLHLDPQKKHNFRIFARNKNGKSLPLIIEDVTIPQHHGLAIEEVFDDLKSPSNSCFVKIEEVFSDSEESEKSWRKIPIFIEEVGKKSPPWLKRWNLKAQINSCYFKSSIDYGDNYFYKVLWRLVPK